MIGNHLLYFCAKRSLRPCAQSKLECTFVRSFVRIFSDFCEEDMRGGHMPLPLGVLNYEFEGFWKKLKKSGRSVHINGICSQEKSGFGSILANFFETLWKRSLWRRLRHLKKAGELESLSCYVRGRFHDLSWRNQCFAPLPCTVYLTLVKPNLNNKHSMNHGFLTAPTVFT